jgi:hypothetical protein
MRHRANIVFALILAFYTYKMVDYDLRKGQHPLQRLDSHSENLSFTGARLLVEQGPGPTSFLPRYGPHYNHNSPAPRIYESDIYTHYFPGPDYVVALFFWLLGDAPRTLQIARLVPLVHVLAAVILLLLLCERHVWRGERWLKCAIAPALLFVPGLNRWAVSLHGQGFSSAYILFGLSLGLLAATKRGRIWKALAAFALGLCSNYMLLTGAFAVCAAPLVGACLREDGREGRKAAFWLSVWVGLGLAVAFGLHLYQIVHQFSWPEAVSDQLGVALVRAGENDPKSALANLFVQYSAEIPRFFGLSTLPMLALSLWFALFVPELRSRRGELAGASLLALAGSWGWVLVMRGHAAHHEHLDPRVFLLQYACLLIVLGAATVIRLGRPPRARAPQPPPEPS